MGRLHPELHNSLALHRKNAGFTQEQMAQAASVSRQTIAAIENGTYNPSTVLALRLALLLAVPVEVLFWLPEQNQAGLHEYRQSHMKGNH